MIARPFIKRTGGKGQLLPELRKHVPKKFGRYVEPFLGGGALFFDLAATRKRVTPVLADRDGQLIDAFRAVRDNAHELIASLKLRQGMWDRRDRAGKEALYYRQRDKFNDDRQSVEDMRVIQAARLIFLNKTGFNGVWRVNGKGAYNVPVGRSKSPVTICDEENLRAASRALQPAMIYCRGFASTLEHAGKGDFVYCDPPYWPVSESASFTAYTRRGFSRDDQEELRDCARRAKERGAHVLLSNADVPGVRKLYKRGFDMRRIEVRRSVNSDPKKRGAVGELLIW